MVTRPETVARLAPAVAVPVAAAWVVGAVLVAWLVPQVRTTSYAASSSSLLWLTAAAGMGLVVAGALGTLVAPRGLFGALALLASVAWVAPAWAGWGDAPSWLSGLTLLVAPLLPPALLHLTVLDGRGRASTSGDRRLVAMAWSATVTIVVARALVYEPLRDRDCWVGCRGDGNPLLVWSDPGLARTLGTALLVATVVAATVAVVRAGVRIGSGSWSVAGAVTLPAAVALLAEAAYAVRLLVQPLERFAGEEGAVLYAVRATALLVLSVSIGWVTAWRLGAARRRVGALAAELAEGLRPGELESRLSRSLRDDCLEIRYRLPGSDVLVDRAGRPASVTAGDRRAAVTVARAREPVATVLYDPQRVSGTELEVGLGALARLVIDNERLRAATLAHVAELQESRARIVATGDDVRRAVERDLHDGAQQRLLAAAYELRLARSDSGGAGMEAGMEADMEAVARLERLVDDVGDALEELRELAHGVFPVVLDEAGLAAALFSLADGGSVPVELELSGVAGPDAVPPTAARTAYVVVRSAVEAATAGSVVQVRVEQQEAAVVVAVAGGGPVDAVRLGDRVGAVGGELEVAPGRVRAVVPCA